jgi:putative transposase
MFLITWHRFFDINLLNIMEKFEDIYRIESTRLKGYDYSSPGLYFVTICTHQQDSILGEIRNGIMVLSAIGEIVLEEWENSFLIRSELFCEEYVIMPDHIHAILRIIKLPKVDEINQPILVETHGHASLHPNGAVKQNRPPKSISSFVAGFKSSATSRINKLRNTPGLNVWQPRFHDRVIRNQEEFYRIKKYIRNNPLVWNTGKSMDDFSYL